MGITIIAVPAFGQAIFNKDALKGIKTNNEKGINTANLESSPAFVGNKIGYVFTGLKGKLFDKEIDEPYFDIGYSDVNDDNSLISRQTYNKYINSELHEGPMSYDPHQNKIFFTRSHREKRTNRNVETDTTYLRIMSADLNAAKPKIDPININVENYSVCHPALMSDGKTIIFSSNRPGGFGKMDLYIAYFNVDEWTGIINMGTVINTAGNEIFPNIVNDSILIFASERTSGIGGLDMYVSKLKDGVWSAPEILPPPFNSPYDDLGLIVRSNGRSGYFSSNRPGGAGKDDIYSFSSVMPIFDGTTLEYMQSVVHVFDKLTLQPIAKAKITVIPLEMDINLFTLSNYNVDMLSGRDPGDVILKLTPKNSKNNMLFSTNETGAADLKVRRDQKYLISVIKDGYAETSMLFDLEVFGPSFNMVMEPEADTDPEPMVKVGTPSDKESTKDDIIIPTSAGSVIVFENIYYDYNKSNILPGAARELDALSKTLIENPDMTVRLEAHTDSRGPAPYNLQLSVDRANAARKYLTDLGIEEDRIEIRGYGESKIRNKCTDKVVCTEEQHRYNRRTEVTIIKN
ncbi:MAG: OmpA family protein [Saprospiraceae bacterium]